VKLAFKMRCVRGGSVAAARSVAALRRRGAPAAAAAHASRAAATAAAAAAAPRVPKRGAPTRSEDAFFHAVRPGSGAAVLGVVDGVGSWRAVGVDAGDFARALAAEGAAAAEAAGGAGGGAPEPVELLAAAAAAVARRGVVGSATALFACLSPPGAPGAPGARLSWWGVGDCAGLLLRPVSRAGGGGAPSFTVAARLPPQEPREFNTPAALGFSPGACAGAFADARAGGAGGAVGAAPGDVLVLSSDGLWDNVEEGDVIALAAAAAARGGGGGPGGPAGAAAAVALALASAARANSVDGSRDSPFARAAKEADILWTAGGRPDDVTVLALVVGSGGGRGGGGDCGVTGTVEGEAYELVPTNAAAAAVAATRRG